MAEMVVADTAAMPRRQSSGILGRRLAPYLFLAPFLILFIAFLIVPLLYALDLSLYKKALVGGTRFVGFDNYLKAFGDRKFWTGVLTLVKFAIMQIPIMLALALFFSLILDSGVTYLKAFFRVSFFIPYAVPTVIAALLWGYLYSPVSGPAAQIAVALGWPTPDFLNPNTILPSIANIATWEYTGYNMIIYFAALQAIPRDLEEASLVDGAGAFAHAIYVKLPLIAPTIMVTIIFSIIGSLQLFSEPYLLINIARTVINSSFTPNIYAYTQSFIGQQYNYAAAISFLLGAVTAVISYVFMLATSRPENRLMPIAGRTPATAEFRRSRWLLTVVLSLYFVYTFVPIFYVIVASTKTNPDLFTTFGLWFSGDFHLIENLSDLFTQDKGIFSRWLWNSFVYAILSGLGAALVSTLAGYAFSKYEFLGKRFIYALVLGAVMIPQTALVIPLFLMLSRVGLLDTPWAVILPQLVFPQGVFLMRAYIDDAVSNEIIDAGRIDGAKEFRIFSTLAFRLVTPAVSTVFVLAFVASWNNYFLPLVVLNSSEHFPITVGLANWYASAAGGSGGSLLYTVVMAGSLVSIVPVIIAFLMIQRFWQGGLSAGAVKA